MHLAHQFQGQTVKGQGYRRAGAYHVGKTRRLHCLFCSLCKHVRVNKVIYYYKTNMRTSAGNCMRNVDKSPKILYSATVMEVEMCPESVSGTGSPPKVNKLFPIGRTNSNSKFQRNRLITSAVILLRE